MTFLSLGALLWLSATALVAWLLPKKISQYGVALACAGFLGLHAPISLALLIGTALLSYFVPARTGKTIIIVATVGVLASVLIWFKLEKAYVVTDLGNLFKSAVPLGLSYYGFRQIHYLFERLKKKLPAHHLGDYLAYLFFLPTFMVGPINLFSDFKRDLSRRRFDTQLLSAGLERVLYGYTKCVILGNYLVSFLFQKQIFEVAKDQPALAEYLDCFRHFMNVYFQFSGYSDVAIGFSLIMGYRIMENFHYPFLAKNINDFWNRWHISLSSWCRAYVFTPVASATRLPYLAIIASMLVLALWHELSLRYVIWGVYHGLGIAAWQLVQRWKRSRNKEVSLPLSRILTGLSIVLTWHFVALGFVLTKEENLTESLAALMRLFGWE